MSRPTSSLSRSVWRGPSLSATSAGTCSGDRRRGSPTMSESNGARARSQGLALRCHSVGKQYGLGQELSLQHTLSTILRRKGGYERFWALSDIGFEVSRGEFFGIVGANGSGKSTLTQLISGIAMPDTGKIEVWGRLVPLLEVGAGFHPELTGRENVVLFGTILGLRQAAIQTEIARIAEFAGVERHHDTPIKRSSSGMQARLSFATAICFPADT